jgi:UDP-N-acetylmuramoyl-L-alanine---L-glutamate ligase
MQLERLCRQKIGLLGYGREGRSVASAIKAYRPDADLTVLVESGEVSQELPARQAPFDDHLLDYQVLIRSPGVPVGHPALRKFRSQGGQIINPASIWFSERPEVQVIGVTGSKGKSTTASLLAHLFRQTGRMVELAGNIGVPLLDHLDTRANLVIAELSSYQLADLEGRLSLGLITRLFDEHLDWHGGQAHYFSCKLRIAELLDGNPLLINAGDEVLRKVTLAIPGRIEGNRPPGFHRQDDRIYLDQAPLISGRELALVGRHNLDNAVLALEAAHLQGCQLDAMVEALRRFRPLPHRLEFVAQVSGRRWVNDAISTSPHATLAALEALGKARVTLIAGGQARPSSWEPVIEWCQQHRLNGLVVLPDNGRGIADQLMAAGSIDAARVHVAADISEAVNAAVQLSSPGGTVLMSPGAPSFPHFRDFEDRGESFRKAVLTYTDRSTA